MQRRVNYLNNKDMLKEVHKSKDSYCEYIDQKYNFWDVIVEDIEEIYTQEVIEAGQKHQAKRLSDNAFKAAIAASDGKTKIKLADHKVKPDTILLENLVFRLVTYDHIPKEPNRKKTPRSVADVHTKLNFVPFKHYILDLSDGADIVAVLKGKPAVIFVGQSHTKDGEFCDTHGSITNKLAKMFMLMVGKYSQRSNWRGYTYLDEMKGQSLLQLSQMGLKFNEAKSDNPFAYYTSFIANSFTRVLNIEKKNQNLRDDLLVQAGQNPSFTRQIAIEEEIRRMRDLAQEE